MNRGIALPELLDRYNTARHRCRHDHGWAWSTAWRSRERIDEACAILSVGWDGEHFVSQSKIQGQISADAPVILNVATKEVVLYFYRRGRSVRQNKSGGQIAREEVLKTSYVAGGVKVGGAILRLCFRIREKSLEREARFQQMRSPGNRYVIIKLVGVISDRCLPETAQPASR